MSPTPEEIKTLKLFASTQSNIDNMIKQMDAAIYNLDLSIHATIGSVPHVPRLYDLADEMKKELKSLKSQLVKKFCELESK